MGGTMKVIKQKADGTTFYRLDPGEVGLLLNGTELAKIGSAVASNPEALTMVLIIEELITNPEYGMLLRQVYCKLTGQADVDGQLEFDINNILELAKLQPIEIDPTPTTEQDDDDATR